MAYGLHWEWRGFGHLDDRIRQRITGLRPLGSQLATVCDRYIWIPGCSANVKLRSWGSIAGLKFKRLIEEDRQSQLQLWLERPEEDYTFPIQPPVILELAKILGVELPGDRAIGDSRELITMLQNATADACVVRVEKSRRAFIWDHTRDAVLVDLAEIRAPVETTTVGLEDTAHLGDRSSAAEVRAANRSVTAAKADLGLPASLETKSYLDILPIWIGVDS
ncbi:MAG: hypothetical protein JSW71_10720 [Gemmatimonadota bacterium]|nr:MAG: hypothetical protein JSW71_10720 [Gemmatimonadota bacterium]